MKRILLLGDSIRCGYDKEVKNTLENTAEVYFPDENCRFAQYILRSLIVWKRELSLADDIDCIHWNAGLWDTLELFEDGTLTPIEFYKDTLNRIYKQMNIMFPKAKIIFATSTPVIEEKFLEPKKARRLNSNIELFNDVAVQIAKEHGAVINDLYSLVKAAPQSYYSDMTHLYTDEGRSLLATQVLKSISETLEIPKNQINWQINSKSEIGEVLGF